MPRKTSADGAGWQVLGQPGFNEAAARCRGKPSRRSPAPPSLACFNEAAARCRGKPAGSAPR